MRTLLYESNAGICFYKETQRGVCTVKVQCKGPKRPHVFIRYTFPDVELKTSSPYLSWENLNCCESWIFDEEYLLTAVQEGKKLYAGCATYLDAPSEIAAAEAYLEYIKASLPDTCTAGREIACNEKIFPFYICRTGTLGDHFDIDEIIADYDRLGMILDPSERQRLRDVFGAELKSFGMKVPFDYANACTTPDVIATGLLLGYPIESTFSFLRE